MMLVEDMDDLDCCATITSPVGGGQNNCFGSDDYLEVCATITSPKKTQQAQFFFPQEHSNSQKTSQTKPSSTSPSSVLDVAAAIDDVKNHHPRQPPKQYKTTMQRAVAPTTQQAPTTKKTKKTTTAQRMAIENDADKRELPTIAAPTKKPPVVGRTVSKLTQVFEQRRSTQQEARREQDAEPVRQRSFWRAAPPVGSELGARNFMEFHNMQRLREDQARKRRELDRERLHSNELAVALHQAKLQAEVTVNEEALRHEQQRRSSPEKKHVLVVDTLVDASSKQWDVVIDTASQQWEADDLVDVKELERKHQQEALASILQASVFLCLLGSFTFLACAMDSPHAAPPLVACPWPLG